MARARRNRGRRRQVNWAMMSPGNLVSVPAGGNAFQLQDGAAGEAVERTIVRTRGNLVISIVDAVAGDAMEVGLGLALVPAATAANAVSPAVNAALPGPLVEADWDGWFWHYLTALHQRAGALDDAVGTQVERIEIDSKAMRKGFSEETAIVLVAQTATIGAASSVQVAFARIRFLLMEP